MANASLIYSNLIEFVSFNLVDQLLVSLPPSLDPAVIVLVRGENERCNLFLRAVQEAEIFDKTEISMLLFLSLNSLARLSFLIRCCSKY